MMLKYAVLFETIKSSGSPKIVRIIEEILRSIYVAFEEEKAIVLIDIELLDIKIAFAILGQNYAAYAVSTSNISSTLPRFLLSTGTLTDIT